MLEKVNMKGKLISVNGAPDFFKHNAYEKRGVDNVKYRTDYIIKNFKMAYPDNEFDVSDFLKEKGTDLDEKLDKLLKYAAVKEDNDLTKRFKGIINRIKFVTEYDCHLEKVDAQVTLIRASDLRDIYIDEAYGLNKFTLNKVTVKYIEGNHYTILANEQLRQIINEIFT
jgi:surfactin synthase thioesterase subunit